MKQSPHDKLDVVFDWHSPRVSDASETQVTSPTSAWLGQVRRACTCTRTQASPHATAQHGTALHGMEWCSVAHGLHAHMHARMHACMHACTHALRFVSVDLDRIDIDRIKWHGPRPCSRRRIHFLARRRQPHSPSPPDRHSRLRGFIASRGHPVVTTSRGSNVPVAGTWTRPASGSIRSLAHLDCNSLRRCLAARYRVIQLFPNKSFFPELMGGGGSGGG